MDSSVKKLIIDELGAQEAGPIIQIIDEQLKLEDTPKVPPLPSGKTYGDWSIFIPYTGEELRPAKALTYDTIEYMLSTGIIRFALDIKRAQTASVMNNEKSIKMVTFDKELANLALRGYMRVAPQFIYEMTFSSLAYGTAFFETPWVTMNGYELGISDKKGSKMVSVPDMPNLVPHRTVRAIRRKTDGTYNGFIQNIYPYFTHPLDARARDVLMGQNDIIVEADASLVVPYNGISRNLWGESFLTPLYTLWFWYELIMRCLVRYSELMGDPIRLAKAPLKKKLVFSDTGKTVEAMDYMLNLAVGLSKSNAVVIPSDLDQETRMPLYDMTYLMTPDKSQPFVQILDMLSQYILQAAVAGTRQAVSEKFNADIGSNTVGNIALHNEMIVNSWVFYINKYFVSKFSTYNRGKGGPPVWMEVQGLDPKEREFMASMMGVAGNSSTFQEFFYQVDWQALGESAGIPMLTPEQTEALKAKLAEQQPQEQPVDQAALELAKNPPLALTSQELSTLKPVELEAPFSIAVSESIRDGFREVTEKLQSNKVVDNKLTKQQVAAIIVAEKKKAVALATEKIALANPYHDEKGRFSEANRNKTGVVGFIKAHPKEVALTASIAGVAIAIGLYNLKKQTTATSESVSGTKQSNGTERVVSSTIIYPEGHSEYGPLVKARCNTAGVMGASVVDDLGVKAPGNIYWHASRFSFAKEMAKDLGHDLSKHPNDSNVVLEWAKKSRHAYAFAANDGKVHFGPEALHNPQRMEFMGATVAHEVFHNRENGHVERTALPMKAEEMMASTVGSIAYQRIKNGGTGKFSKKDLTADFWNSARDIGDGPGVGYSAGYRKTLFRAAAYKMRATNAIAKGAGLPIPYSHPVDVVSQWFSSENAHSDIHSWIRKSGGVITPTGSYSFPGFKFLGTIQLEDSIKLIGNPFHDRSGRFTSSSLSVGLINSYKDRIPAKLDPKMKVVVAKDWNQTKQLLGTSNQHILGAYHNHTLVLSPNVNKQNAERVVRHEAYHGRVRANGLTGVNTMNKHTVDLEEGTTELLTFRGFKGGDPSRSWYYPQMKNVASVARKASGGDNKKAWKFVDNLHYYNGSSQSVSAIAHHTGQSDVSKYLRGNNSGDDLQWLLSHPVNLEDFDELFAESEQAIYNELRKIGAKEIELVSVPEELL